jgi:hypothetical protein
MAAGYDGSIRIDSRVDTKGFNSGIASITKSLKGLGSVLGVAFGVKALIDFGKAAIDVASDLVEVQNVVDVTFGKMAEHVNEFSKTALTQFGLSELSAKTYTSTMGAMLKSSGFGVKAATNMSIEIAKLTADMASFYNLDTDVAFDKIRSGLSGQTEPLKQLGINMNIANLEAFALSQGIKKSYQHMSQAEQTLLRYNYLLAVSADSHGDFARNAGTWANQVKILTERWKEFSALIGKALMEILLPMVKFLNKTLDVLISITKEIGKIYTLITGKEVVVEANNNIAGSADDAAESEEDLSKGIKKAGKEAKKALAPFDELNILQNSLGSGNGGTIGLDNFKTNINTNQVTDGLSSGFKKAEDDGNRFYLWFIDWLSKLRSAALIPIPAPIFEPLQSPIYRPNWGLTPPLIPVPAFPPIPNPVYRPNWNLELPLIPQVVFPPIEYREYSYSLETLKTRTAETLNGIKQSAASILTELTGIVVGGYGRLLEGASGKLGLLEQKHGEISRRIEEETKSVSERIKEGLATSWSTIETNYNRHKENMGIIASAVSAVLVANINQGLSTMGTNVNNTISTVQGNLQTFGRNVGVMAAEIAKSFAANISEGFRVTAQNFVTFANSLGSNLKTFGSGVLSAAAETARGFVDNMVSGFRTVWDNFKNLMSGIGEKISGWFSENKSIVLKTTIAAGVVLGVGALALAAPATLPYIGTALGGLASIPALATGAVIPPNSEFLAILGDQKSGRNLEAPEGLIRQIMKEELGGIVQSGGDIHLTVKIGEDTLLEYLIDGINRENRIKGEAVVNL